MKETNKTGKFLKGAAKLITLGNGYPKGAFNSAIIVAAGSGTRAGKGVPKQFCDVGGIPIAARTVSTFEGCSFINEIIIVAKPGTEPIFTDYMQKFGWTKVKKIVTGKASRQLSVFEGFKAISDDSDYVYIHDGVRCLVTEEMIERVGEAACLNGIAIAAKKASDSIKIADKNDKVSSSPDRKTVWQAQTPQVFKTEIYRAAAYTALKNEFDASDDAMLAEACGFPVKLVDCGEENIKITAPVDFLIAEAILKYREEKSKEQSAKERKDR